jgi:hypothetical protein
METATALALAGLAVALATPLITRWVNVKGWPEAIDAAISFAKRHQLSGNTIRYRNSKRRRLGTRVSIMVDVYGPQSGVYLILIDRSGRIINIDRLRGWKPR